jgi:hypothetical protein
LRDVSGPEDSPTQSIRHEDAPSSAEDNGLCVSPVLVVFRAGDATISTAA